MTTSDGVFNPAVASMPMVEEAQGVLKPTAPAAGARSITQTRWRTDLLLVAKLIGVFAIAFGLRLWIIAQPGLGHDEDLELFQRWTRGLMEHGLAGFYQAESFCDYPPLMVLLFRGVGAVAESLTGTDPSGFALRFGIKALACLADLAIAILLLLEGRRLLSARAGLLACSFYLLNPVTLYDSAYWGQMDSIYTAFMLAALLFVSRQRWAGSGIAAALSLTAKFQAIAILPIVLLEVYRLGGWRGLRNLCVGGTIAAAGIAAPFFATGTLREVVDRAYVNVVGQYHEKSKNAYNIWHLLGDPAAADVSPPAAIVRVAADGRDSIRVGESWLLHLTWRRISLVLFALSVAIVLSLYAFRPGPIARYGAAGLLAFCFFLFPTEMHERYAFPAVALLAVWAAARSGNERIYWIFTLLLTLNLAAVLPAAPLASQIAAANIVVFALILAGLLLARSSQEPNDAARSPAPDPVAPLPRARLVPVFQSATALALVGAIGLAFWIYVRYESAPEPSADRQAIWLSSLNPTKTTQGWGSLGIDSSVSGGQIQIGDTIYTRGLGTHAPATITYEIPAGSEVFEAVAGVDVAAQKRGSFIVHVELDGKSVFTSPTLSGESEPLPIRVAVTGAQTLTLRIEPTRDGKRSDHADLALACFHVARPPNQ